MTWTTPFTAVTGQIMMADDWNESARDNLLHLRALTGDPGGVDELLVSSSTTAAAFGHPVADTVLTAGSVTGTSGTSAIGTGVIKGDRFAAGSFDSTAVGNAFATGAISQALLATAVQNKLIFAGVVGLVRTAAEIATGWSRETALDGRFMIGAGSSFALTFNEATDYGSSWSHSHDLGGHTHSFTVSSGSPDATQTDMPGPPPAVNSASTSHTHSGSGTSGGPDVGSSSTAWQIPGRGYVFCRRNLP